MKTIIVKLAALLVFGGILGAIALNKYTALQEKGVENNTIQEYDELFENGPLVSIGKGTWGWGGSGTTHVCRNGKVFTSTAPYIENTRINGEYVTTISQDDVDEIIRGLGNKSFVYKSGHGIKDAPDTAGMSFAYYNIGSEYTTLPDKLFNLHKNSVSSIVNGNSAPDPDIVNLEDSEQTSMPADELCL